MSKQGDSWGEYNDSGRVCRECLEFKVYTEFHKHSGCPFGYNTVCKSCRIKKSKQVWLTRPYIKKMYDRAKSRAILKNLEFSIQMSDIVIPEVCPVFGVELIPNTKYAPSLDRIDSTKGYIQGNVQVISTRANTLKNNGTLDELKQLIDFLSKGVCEIV